MNTPSISTEMYGLAAPAAVGRTTSIWTLGNERPVQMWPMIDADDASKSCCQRIAPGTGLPTLAPPPLVHDVAASISQSHPWSSTQRSLPLRVDSPSALSKKLRNALTATRCLPY